MPGIQEKAEELMELFGGAENWPLSNNEQKEEFTDTVKAFARDCALYFLYKVLDSPEGETQYSDKSNLFNKTFDSNYAILCPNHYSTAGEFFTALAGRVLDTLDAS